MLEDGAWFTLVGSMCVGECKKNTLSSQLPTMFAHGNGDGNQMFYIRTRPGAEKNVPTSL
jgi:hypothetical protein